jgi:hypothetical protein
MNRIKIIFPYCKNAGLVNLEVVGLAPGIFNCLFICFLVTIPTSQTIGASNAQSFLIGYWNQSYSMSLNLQFYVGRGFSFG